MPKGDRSSIKIRPFDAEAIRRAKGANRRAIAAATPEQREEMQRSYSLVGINREDITMDRENPSGGFL